MVRVRRRAYGDNSSSAAPAAPITCAGWNEYPLPLWTPFVAGLIGGTIGSLTGRACTRMDNFFLGALLSGFAAFRDPQPDLTKTFIISAIEGLVAGGADRLVPKLKEAVMGDGEDEEAGSPALQPALA